ncbi:hypothetical protein OS176_09490 [Xanthomonadaceae bacterium XH05]|nr:hypothetical protein [Xanthomonadaceae bacterium XH05]
MSLPLGGALALVLFVGVAAFAGGVWFGADLQAGRTAIAEQGELRRQIESLGAAALELRRRGLAVAQDFRTAQIRFEHVADELSQDLASLDAAFAASRADIESLLARHPDWVDCRIGPGGVHAWNAAAAGARPATAAATGLAGGADAAVRTDAAAAEPGQPAGAAAQLRGGRAPVPPLPLPAGAADGGPRPL